MLQYQLYLEDSLIDVDKNLSIPLNKVFEDLNDPTKIVTDYSKTIDLPLTDNNNKFFGQFYQLDRTIIAGGSTNTGIYFDPTKKISFKIVYNSRIMIDGYAKMNNSNNSFGKKSYQINLFGSTANFLNKLKSIQFKSTLADNQADVIENVLPDRIKINSQFVMDSITNATPELTLEYAGNTDIIGYAMTNRGMYKEFDNKNAFIHGEGMNSWGELVKQKQAARYQIEDADALFPSGLNENQIDQFRSYYQRPYIYTNKILQVIQKKMNEVSDYKLIFSDTWFNDKNPYWTDLVYLCDLPTFKDLDSIKYTAKCQYKYNSGQAILLKSTASKINTTDKKTFTLESEFGDKTDIVTANTVQHYDIVNTTNQSDKQVVLKYNITANIFIYEIDYDTDTKSDTVYLHHGNGLEIKVYGAHGGLEDPLVPAHIIRIVAPNSEVFIDPIDRNVDGILEYIVLEQLYYNKSDRRAYVSKNKSAQDTLNLELKIPLQNYSGEFIPTITVSAIFPERPLIKASSDTRNVKNMSFNGISISPTFVGGSVTTGSHLATLETINKVRSNSDIKFENLINDKVTPAAFLLNYVKMFNLLFDVNYEDKTLTIIDKGSYYTNNKTIDWTDKVDRSKDFVMTPVTFEDRYVQLNYDDVDAAYLKDYKSRYGLNYGEYRLDTGYQFNDKKKMLFTGLMPSVVSIEKVRKFKPLWKDLDYTTTTNKYMMPSYFKKNSDASEDISFYGSFFFRNDNVSVGDDEMYLTDDHPAMVADNQYTHYGPNRTAFNRIGIKMTEIPQLSLVDKSGMYGCVFSAPSEVYTDNPIDNTPKYIYESCWKNWIDERYNSDNKSLTSYFHLTLLDYFNLQFKDFIKIENRKYAINKVFDFNANDDETTKVELIQINDASKYYNASEQFSYINLSTYNIEIDDDSPRTIQVASSGEWSVSSPKWIKVKEKYFNRITHQMDYRTVTDGMSGERNVYLFYDAYITTRPRYGKVVFYNDTISKTIDVKQNPNTGFLEVTNVHNVDARTNTYNTRVKSSSDWSAVSNNSNWLWCKVEGANLVYTVSTNRNSVTRTGTITVTNLTGKIETVTIIQNRASTIVPITITPVDPKKPPRPPVGMTTPYGPIKK